MKNLYLDIDGVLLTKHGEPAPHLVDFLNFATTNFDCHWLTTHCKGNSETALLYLADKVPPVAIPLLEKIKPTNWKLWKTEGIDFTKDFFWIDDYAFEAEKTILEEKERSDNLVTVDLKSKPNQLQEIMICLEEVVAERMIPK